MKQMKVQGEPRLKSPEEMVKYVHKNDAHLMISIWASFGPWTEQYRELKKMNALLPFETWPRNSGVMPDDVFNPKARNLYWKYLTHLYQMGFDAGGPILRSQTILRSRAMRTIRPSMVHGWA